MFEPGALRLQRGDDRGEIVADAPDDGVGAVGAGIFGLVDDELGGAGAADEHAFLLALTGELQAQHVAVELAGPVEVAAGDDGGALLVLPHQVSPWTGTA